MNVMSGSLGMAAIAMAEPPTHLSEIHRPDCAAVIWPRQPLPSFQSWIDAVSPAQLPKTRIILRPEQVYSAVTKVCDLSETPDGEERTRLIGDISALADMFAGLMDVPYLRLRLDVVSNNQCRKFHVDSITARLICTYRGPGTQYGFSLDEAEPRQIETVATGAPIILRGNKWSEHPKSGLVHRSPPIEDTGETRLVLVLDPITDPDSELNEKFLN